MLSIVFTFNATECGGPGPKVLIRKKFQVDGLKLAMNCSADRCKAPSGASKKERI